MTIPILVYPDPNKPYILCMDASKYACSFTPEEFPSEDNIKCQSE